MKHFFTFLLALLATEGLASAQTTVLSEDFSAPSFPPQWLVRGSHGLESEWVAARYIWAKGLA